MDVAEVDRDVKLYKHARDLVKDLDRGITTQLRKPDGRGGSQVRPWVRLGEAMKQTCAILDSFQELPQLLDPHLPRWIPFLAETYLEYLQAKHRHGRVRNRSGLLAPLDLVLCKILYSFCKVRGEKVIVRFLNVEAKYLELLLSAVEEAEQASDGAWAWEQRYIALLWLSHLLLAPFDLATISSTDLEEGGVPEIPGFEWPAGVPGLTMRVVPLAVKYLARAGKERDAAKALLVRLALRRDMQEIGVLRSLVRWALGCLKPAGGELRSPYFLLGVLSFLAGLLRSTSETSDLDAHLSSIFEAVLAVSQGHDAASKTIMSLALARKMMLKVMRSLTVSVLRRPRDPQSTELAETAIGYLLEILPDSDTPVRLAASKALSIITLRLDPQMASQVVDAILESLNRNLLWSHRVVGGGQGAQPVRDISAVNPLEWHGLMLTLSHLLYRRSPPAAQLSDIFHALLLGLSFEQRGVTGTSIGSNVRDAACFGIWALARRYTTRELLAVPTKSAFAAAKARSHAPATSILQILGTELVMTASLEPEGNIRRGASAALQELIGRHPDTVEQGIGVVQVVDYHAVARRSRAIQAVASGATALSAQYGEAIADGILSWRGIGDLDTSSRRASGAAFGALTAQLSDMSGGGGGVSRFETSIELVMERLDGLQRRQVEERHGLLLCFAAVVNQLCEQQQQQQQQQPGASPALKSRILACVAKILEECERDEYRRPELIAEAASRLVVSTLPLILDVPEKKGSTMLSPERRHEHAAIASAFRSAEIAAEVHAVVARLADVMPKWLSRNEPDTVEPVSAAGLMLLILSEPQERDALLAGWAGIVATKPSSLSSAPTEGYLQALALAQPLAQRRAMEQEEEEEVVDVVSGALLQRWKDDQDINTRVAILQSLLRGRILRDRPGVFLDVLAEGLDDYTTTARGDEGSLVRVQALRAVQVLWADLSQEEEWTGLSMRKLLFSVLRLSAEKLDRVRREAKAVVALLLAEKEAAAEVEASAFTSKAYFLQLLHLATAPVHKHAQAMAQHEATIPWMAALLSGLVSSADTGNEELIMETRAAMCAFCAAPAARAAVCAALAYNLDAWRGEDRVAVPTLEMIGFLLSVGVYGGEGVRWRGLCLAAQRAGYRSGNVRKLVACARVYGGVAAADGDGEGGREARRRLGAMMGHPWPKVRSAVVDELWGLGLGEDVLTGVDWAGASRGQISALVTELGLA